MATSSVRTRAFFHLKPQFWFGAAILVPLVIWYAVFSFIPMGRTLWISLNTYNALNPSLSYYSGLANYRALFADPQFSTALQNSGMYVLVKAGLAVPLALFLAILLERSRFRQFFTFAYFLPGVMSILATAVLFRYFYDPNVGLFNSILNGLHLPSQSYISTEDQALVSVAAMDAWRSFGFYTLLLLAGLLDVPQILYEAAEIDGASAIDMFFHVTLPLLRRTLLLVVVVAGIDGLQAFAAPYVLTGPGRSTLVLAGLIYNQGLQYLNFGYASAAAFVLFVIVMLVSLAQLRLLRSNWEY